MRLLRIGKDASQTARCVCQRGLLRVNMRRHRERRRRVAKPRSDHRDRHALKAVTYGSGHGNFAKRVASGVGSRRFTELAATR